MQRSLGLTLARAMGAGWENVTASTLSLDPHLVRLGEVTLPPVRAQLTPAFIFVRVWKDHLCPFIAQAINSDLPVPQRNIHREAALVSSEEMWCYVRVLVWMIAHPPTTWEAWRADPHLPEGLSLTRLRKIKAWLNFDDVKAAEMLCDELRKWVKVPGRVTLDETMIGWKGSHPAVVYIPRKPVPTGVKCFNISCQFSRSGKAFLLHFLPDVGSPFVTKYASLAWAMKCLEPSAPVSFTADSWFGMLPWLEAHTSVPFTVAIPSNQDKELLELFTWRLRQGEYRVFRKGDLLLCVFVDGKVVRTSSSCYNVAPSPESVHAAEETTLEERLEIEPVVSDHGTQILKSLCKEDLMNIARRCGESSSKRIYVESLEEIERRVAELCRWQQVRNRPPHSETPCPHSFSTDPWYAFWALSSVVIASIRCTLSFESHIIAGNSLMRMFSCGPKPGGPVKGIDPESTVCPLPGKEPSNMYVSTFAMTHFTF